MEISERNLQEIGKSLFLSLPKGWTKGLNLKKGSKVKVRTSEDGTLIISPEFVVKSRKKSSSITYRDGFIRDFFKEYFAGSEEIVINFTKKISEEESKQIYSFFAKFMNVQIVEESSSKIVVKCFKIEELSIEECLKRMFFISSNMIDEVLDGNSKLKLEEMELSLTKFYFILVMQIRRFLDEGKFAQENQVSLIRAMDYRMIGERIERVADIVKDFSELDNNDVKKSFVYFKEVYDKAFWCFFNQKYENSLKVFEDKDLARIHRLRDKAFKSRDIGFYDLMVKVSQLVLYCREIAGFTK